VDGPVVAEVAVIWDPQAWWALQGPGLPSDDLDYLSQARSVHAAAWRAGITVDIVAPGADLSRYRAVLAPSLFLISAATAASVRDYVSCGGALAVWFFSGVVDPDVRVWPGGYPGPLADVLGLRVEEVQPIGPGEQVGLSGGASGSRWMELVRLHGASAEMRYADGPLVGEPAITRHDVGAGQAYYVSTRLDDASLDAFVSRICGAPPAPPPGVEVVRRADGSRFVLNHSDQAVTIPASGFDVIAAAPVTDQVRLPPGGVAVIVQSAPPARSR
jgi:beta-galactosidase